MLQLSIDAFNDFECIGSACEDTCCKGWTITIDQNTYFRYKRETNPEFKSKFEKSTIRINPATKDAYALMALNQNNECMFLDENKLCSIYKLLGPEKMCHTCRAYPRQTVEVYDIVQKSISLSCPEACRKVLFRENALEFNLEDAPSARNELIFNLTKEENKLYFGKEVFFALRSFAIGLLQNRNYSLEERLLILGMFIEDASGKKDSDILKVIDSYSLKLNNGVFKNIASYIDKDNILDAEIRCCVNIYLSIINTFKNVQTIKTMSIINDGLNLSKNSDFDEFKKNYLDIKNNYANELFEQYHYVFENYLVNYIFKNPTMFLDRDLMSSYAEMLIYYNMIRFSMRGIIGSLKDNLTENDLVLAISTVSRGAEHNASIVQSLKTLLDKLNLNNLSNLIPLILN